MSHLSALFGPVDPPPENVKVGAWVLCRPCSRGIHDAGHTTIDRCQCDLCEEESA